MKLFDPGGALHALAGCQPMAYLHSHSASSGESGLVQPCTRREFFFPRGLKEGILLEDAEKRVLHCTHRATLYFTARTAPVSALQGSLDNGHFSSTPNSTGQFIHSRRKIKASDGFPETVAGSREGQEHTPVDCSSRGHKKIMGFSNVQQGVEKNSSHVSSSFDKSVVLSNHLGSSSSCLSKPLQNNCHSIYSNFDSLQALHIPRALELHISCDEMWLANEFGTEDPEAPSTPDLQLEVRSWDCEALCTTGVDQMLPADNFCPTDANDLVLVQNLCNEDADGMLPAHKLLLKEEDIVSTCMVQCTAGPAKGFNASMKQGEDTCKDDSCVSDLSYKCSGGFLCGNSESTNSKNSSRKLNSSARRQHMAQQLFYGLMISARSFCRTSNNETPHSHFLCTSQSLQRLIRSLKLERFSEGEVISEQLLTDIQIFLQVYTPRLIPDQDPKAAEGSPAAGYHKLAAHKQAHVMVKKYSGRRDHLQNMDTKLFVQEKMLSVLRFFSQRYLARRSEDNFWLRFLYLGQDILGNHKLNQCSSRLPSKVSIISAADSPYLLETKNEGFPRSTEFSREMMHDFEENLAESFGPSSWGQKNGSIKMMEVVDNWNGIPIEQVGESLDTCRSHLQAPPLAFPFHLTKLPVTKKQSGALNIKCSNDNIIDGGHTHDLVCTKDNRDKASCLPMSAVGGPCSPTFSQCSLSLGFGMEEFKTSMLYGEVHERYNREKLEHFAEVFLLQRHIKQQQRRAQQAPPYPCRESVGLATDAKGLTSAGLLAVGKPSPYTCRFTNASTKSLENMNHEPTKILTSSLTKPCDANLRLREHGNCVGADVVIDIVGLVKYLESNSSQLETWTDAAVNSIGCTHMPFKGGRLVIPNVNAMVVTIVAIVVYTKILLESAMSWVGSRTHSKEEK